MNRTFAAMAGAIVCLCALPSLSAGEGYRIPRGTGQLIVVLTKDWDATEGRMARFTREGKAWKAVGEPAGVAVGQTGLGWGRGLLPADINKTIGGPVKQEGDKRAPAGLFELHEATGYAASPPAGTTLEYRQATEELRCVDDVASSHYNLILRAPPGGPAWRSDEKMKRADACYTWVIVVEHNRAPILKGAGSCIFMHVWRAPGQPTVGCTAMDLADVERLLQWIDVKRRPVLVQLPEAIYAKVWKGWGLPEIPAAIN